MLRCLEKVNTSYFTTHRNNSPWKTKLTVKKYVPIGSVIMAKVKLINFQITDLWFLSVAVLVSTKGDSRWHCWRGVGRLGSALPIVV